LIIIIILWKIRNILSNNDIDSKIDDSLSRFKYMSEKEINDLVLVCERIKDSTENKFKFKDLSLENILEVDNNLNIGEESTTKTKYSHLMRDTTSMMLVVIRYLMNS